MIEFDEETIDNNELPTGETEPIAPETPTEETDDKESACFIDLAKRLEELDKLKREYEALRYLLVNWDVRNPAQSWFYRLDNFMKYLRDDRAWDEMFKSLFQIRRSYLEQAIRQATDRHECPRRRKHKRQDTE